MYRELYQWLDECCDKLRGCGQLEEMFRKCFLNTLETTVKDTGDSVFIITGDIDAMWLRDSSVQVSHYVQVADRDPDAASLIRRVLLRQYGYICIDPYANAFLPDPSGLGWKDITRNDPWVWERKYEIDSLVYPLWLTCQYCERTGDLSVLGMEFKQAFSSILDTFEREQNHAARSDYSFIRPDSALDTLDNNGHGADCAYTGLVFSAFRPSDDRCRYHYLVPSNLFICSVFRRLMPLLTNMDQRRRAQKLVVEIERGIERCGIVEHEKYGRIYAYETDGLGNYLLMDDANVPNLLGLPYLGVCGVQDPVYRNTRNFCLSPDNPYYFEGKSARGLGSPHTPQGWIWHIGLIMQALTSQDTAEIAGILRTLLDTTAGTGYMHESFCADDPGQFSRSWFAWANTMFAVLILQLIEGGFEFENL